MVRVEPFISQKSIRAILEGMLYHGNEEASSLESLTLVDDLLERQHIPHMENRRLFALRALISSLITDQLSTYRRNFGLPQPIIDEVLEYALTSIKSDVRQQSAEFVGWSLLYYRYVRVDLNLTLVNYSAISHIDERTLRRHQARTIERLRDLIAEREAQIRLKRKQLYLIGRLPNGTPRGIVGRSDLVKDVRKLLKNSPPAHLLLTGATGIGKSTFAHLLLYEAITAGELDEIVWIQGAKSAAFAENYIQQRLLPEDSQIDLAAYLADHRVAIVFDDTQALVRDITAFQMLISSLTNASLIVIHPTHIALTADFKHILLPKLQKEDVFAIASNLRSFWTNQEHLADYTEQLWQIAGGNPLAIKLAANNLNNANLRQLLGLTDKLMHTLIANVYDAISRKAKQTLFIMTLCPPLELSKLASVWPFEPLSHDAIIELISGGLFDDIGEGQYRLSDNTRRYVQGLYISQPDVRIQFDKLVDALTHCLMENAEACFGVVEHILLQSWPKMSITRRLTWVELAVDLGIQHGNYAVWATILEGQGDQNFSPDLQIKRAICLRKLGKWAEAEEIIRAVIEQAGLEGDFVRQGRANLELSVILRQQGLYERAYSCARRALDVFQRFEKYDFLPEAEFALAQIAFDAGHLSDAKAFLRHDAPNNTKKLSLLGEIHLAINETREAYQCVSDAMTLCQPDSAEMGRLHALMGRVYFAQGDWGAAENHFSKAISLLEMHSDQFALARAKTNLAAGLLAVRQYQDDARKLLTDARNTQIAIRDRHGLMITQHNLDELDRQVAVDEW